MKNVQISFDESLLDVVDRIAALNKLSRSAIIREALRKWVREQEAHEFEKKWIEKLQEHQEGDDDIDEWEKIEAWGD